jgi:HEAT repeat protein
VATKSHWGLTPRESIEAECARRGTSEVVAGCIRLVRQQDVDAALIMALGGPGAGKFLDGRPHVDRYWLRVWGLRGLLWSWDESAAPAVQAALADESWRVREMAAKVIAKRSIGDAMSAVVQLRQDPVVRVRAAAERAVHQLSQASA